MLGSEAHAGVPLRLGQGLYLACVELPVVKQRQNRSFDCLLRFYVGSNMDFVIM